MLLYIALGSALGGVLRYLIGGLIQRLAGTGWPVGTLVVNVSGSLLLGVLLRHALTSGMSAELRALIAVGLCGGYTTFSTFSYETAALVEDGAWMRAAGYVAASVVLSLIAMFAGFAAARELAR